MADECLTIDDVLIDDIDTLQVSSSADVLTDNTIACHRRDEDRSSANKQLIKDLSIEARAEIASDQTESRGPEMRRPLN